MRVLFHSRYGGQGGPLLRLKFFFCKGYSNLTNHKIGYQTLKLKEVVEIDLLFSLGESVVSVTWEKFSQ